VAQPYSEEETDAILGELNDRARQAAMKGDFQSALPLLEEAMDLVTERFGADHPLAGATTANLAAISIELGDFETGERMTLASLAITEGDVGPDHPSLVPRIHNLGGVRRMRGDYDGALEAYERAIAIRREELGDDHPALLWLLSDKALTLTESGRHRRGETLTLEVLAVRERILGTNHVDVSDSLMNASFFHMERADYVGARDLVERALAIRENSPAPRPDWVGHAMGTLAHMLHKAGDVDRAIEMNRRSIELVEKSLGPTHPAVAGPLGNLAGMLSLRKDPEAGVLYERLLEVRSSFLPPGHPDMAETLFGMAHWKAGNDQPDEAMELVDRALAIWLTAHGEDHPRVSQYRTLKANILEDWGDSDLALNLRRDVLAKQEDLLGPEHPEVAKSLQNLAHTLHELEEYEEAERHLIRARLIFEGHFGQLDAMSEREALRFMSQARVIFDAWLVAGGQAVEVWASVLHWKGAATRRIRARSQQYLLDEDARAVLVELRQTRRALAQHYFSEARPIDREALEKARVRLERELAAMADLPDLDAPSPEAVCDALPDGQRLIDFVRHKTSKGPEYTAFIVRNNCHVDAVFLGLARPIDERIEAWRAALSEPDQAPKRVDERGRAVAELLWAPVAEKIGRSSVIILPDGPLSAVPFGALPTENGYVIEDRAVSYVDSATALVRQSTHLRGTGMLAVGDVDFDGEAVGSRELPCWETNPGELPATGREVASLADRWNKGAHRREPALILTGANANEPRVSKSLAGQRLVHLATHGFFATGECRGRTEANPLLLSGLVLAPTETSDGVLTAEEISTLDLSGTELVVLSACETGLGEIETGEGVLGLRSAFSAAGAQQIVMSLWAVPDEDTRRLMDPFYARVLHRKRPIDPAEALRAAQLDLLKELRQAEGEVHAGRWAAFLVSGQPS